MDTTNTTGPHNYVVYINNNDLNLNFPHASNSKFVNFLDVTLESDPDTGVVLTMTFRKRCGENAILLATSCHPQQHIICKRLQERGYPPTWCIERGFRTASCNADITSYWIGKGRRVEVSEQQVSLLSRHILLNTTEEWM